MQRISSIIVLYHIFKQSATEDTTEFAKVWEQLMHGSGLGN